VITSMRTVGRPVGSRPVRGHVGLRGVLPVPFGAGGCCTSLLYRVTVWLFLAVASATKVWPGEGFPLRRLRPGAVWLPPVRDGWPRNRRGFPGCRGPRASSPGRRPLAPGRRAGGPPAGGSDPPDASSVQIRCVNGHGDVALALICGRCPLMSVGEEDASAQQVVDH
jgi:hypothetical protein